LILDNQFFLLLFPFQNFQQMNGLAELKQLLAGDKKIAADYFTKCLATEAKTSTEYLCAGAARTPKQERPIAKVGAKTKAGTGSKKAREEELAKERRRAGRPARKDMPLPSPRGSEKQRPSPGR
jgi:hypothetical protein